LAFTPRRLTRTNWAEGSISETLVNVVRHHQAWAPAVVFILAFGESLAFVSLLLPATAILLAVGGLIGVADIAFWPIWWAAALGAVFGDWFSYWLGCRYSYAIARIWPLSRHPGLLPRGESFFRKWGTLGVFIGRFFGPLRSIMPLVAGIFRMRQLPFQMANVASAIIWATGVLTPGMIAVEWLL
jgi:membrane protein DedA with SNARE-associated domain